MYVSGVCAGNRCGSYFVVFFMRETSSCDAVLCAIRVIFWDYIHYIVFYSVIYSNFCFNPLSMNDDSPCGSMYTSNNYIATGDADMGNMGKFIKS